MHKGVLIECATEDGGVFVAKSDSFSFVAGGVSVSVLWQSVLWI